MSKGKIIFLLLLLGGIGFGVYTYIDSNTEKDMDIFAVEPRVGPQNSESSVVIHGQGFKDDIGYTVFFGTNRAKAVVIADSQTLMVRAPIADKVGAVDIAVRPDFGDAFLLHGAFTYGEGGTGSAAEGIGEIQKSEKGNLVY